MLTNAAGAIRPCAAPKYAWGETDQPPAKICLGNAHVVQACRMIFFGKFAIKAANQSNRLITRQKPVTDLMTSLCRTPTKTKFDVLHVIVEAIDFII